ncbi:protein-L-isoaspartate O-methyltransferase family protein [Shimia ponticola]|uniref:protein-L-isoaspartate O-methyltransferase family protein n=1 Tax=Shimia ponticola TaxID=2582893 RepID=UPI0011BF550D|nr:protein-L-isoaspartate O-methyltransferase [Shimia ponticola]
MIDYVARRTTMVDTQVRPSDVTKLPIIDALLTVRREAFVPDALRDAAYMGEHIELERDRVVLDARTFSKLLDAIDIQANELVLDIGCGLGYSTAVLGRLGQAVIGVEDDEGRAKEAETLLAEETIDNAVIVNAALTDGALEHAPFDVIVIEGAVQSIPATLCDQLAEGGRIAAIFAEGSLGVARVGYKIDGEVSWRDAFNAMAPVLPGFEQEVAFSL